MAEQRLTEAEREAVLAADLVLAGRRCQDDAEVYLLADISAGVGPHDVEREAGAAPPRSRRSDGRVFRPRVS